MKPVLVDITGGASLRRRFSLCARGASVLAMACAIVPAMADVGRPPAVIPARADIVLEHLPRGYSRLMSVAPSASATLPETLAEAERLYATASETGDMRLSTRADALLARLPSKQPPSELLNARAFGAQHRHDFDGAVRLLDEAVKLEPRDGDARFARSGINLVRGQLAEAKSDCIALALGIDEGKSMLCIGSLALRRNEFAGAKSMADRWLSQTTATDPLRRYALVMRGEIAARAGDADTDQWFRQALALAPDDVRTLAAYVRYLRAQNRQRDILTLLEKAPDTDALQLQRALAAHALGLPEAAAMIDAQGRRYALAHSVGSQPEMRDEAEYLLTLKRDPKAALALARKNFETQRDYEDVDLMQRASSAAGDATAMQAVQKWAESQKLALSPAAKTSS